MKNKVYITPQTAEYQFETFSQMLSESPVNNDLPTVPTIHPAPVRNNIPGNRD